MPRCILCNYSSEIDKGTKKVEWDDGEKGFICSDCRSSINDAVFEQEDDEDLGGLAILDIDYDDENPEPDSGVPNRRDISASPAVLEGGHASIGDDTT